MRARTIYQLMQRLGFRHDQVWIMCAQLAAHGLQNAHGIAARTHDPPVGHGSWLEERLPAVLGGREVALMLNHADHLPGIVATLEVSGEEPFADCAGAGE